jgi:hypothetical protein
MMKQQWQESTNRVSGKAGTIQREGIEVWSKRWAHTQTRLSKCAKTLPTAISQQPVERPNL